MKRIVIYLPNEEEAQNVKKVNLGDTEHCIYLQDLADVLPDECDKIRKWKIWDIPLYIKRNNLLMQLNQFGKVKQLHLVTKNMWQLAHMEFESVEAAEQLSVVWLIWIRMDCL